ncbi:MAG: zinc ribbon domain-containing protein [Thermoleophilia bacterium]|nr:zinc ribbon domain-containing protein [Thermoleophilia bacterium]
MPVYDYRCEKGHRFDAFQGMTEKPLKKCEECGAKVERVLHAPAIHFKGSGFHNTDYNTKPRPVESGSAPSDGAKPASDSGGQKTVGLDKI